ncbi:hypothetical protein [Mycetocola miduiensis]|uniref:DUF4287 domain-containing protein n=1 Tax=Mycetocola miduiensis TaxID=995034 RepID=A0A1I5DHC3_9MICO|nr:hypothetical protein [Mycetocola miduiensis]SFN98570.1 hypothetical protein SAMN05216219_2922 [Mycetocola miduiensis]
MVVSRLSDSIGDASVLAATGRSRASWRETLENARAVQWNHTVIAAWLVAEHGVGPWWAQNITVDFEQHSGRRRPGQRADGSFEVTVSRRLPVGQEDALAQTVASVSAALDLPAASVNSGGRYCSARWKLHDGSAVTASVWPTSGEKTTVALSHVGLASESSMHPAKEFLRGALPPALR